MTPVVEGLPPVRVGVLTPGVSDLQHWHDAEVLLQDTPLPDGLQADVDVRLAHVSALSPAQQRQVLHDGTRCLFILQAGDLAAWYKVICQGHHGFVMAGASPEEGRARLLCLGRARDTWNELASTFVRGLGHDVLSSVQAVELNVRGLERLSAGDPEAQEEISDTLEAIGRIQLLVKGASNLGRHPDRERRTMAPAPLNLGRLVYKVADLPAFHGTVRVDVDEDLPVIGSARMLQRALEDVVRTLYDLKRGSVPIEIKGIELYDRVSLLVRTRVYDATMKVAGRLTSREGPIRLRDENVRVPVMALAFAKEVCLAHGGRLTARAEGADHLTVRMEFPPEGA